MRHWQAPRETLLDALCDPSLPLREALLAGALQRRGLATRPCLLAPCMAQRMRAPHSKRRDQPRRSAALLRIPGLHFVQGAAGELPCHCRAAGG